MLKLWWRASVVLTVMHVAAVCGVFFILFCVARYEADHPDVNCSAILIPGRYLLEGVLMQPTYSVWGNWPGCLGCFGLLLNSALWGVAGGLVVAVAARSRRRSVDRGRR